MAEHRVLTVLASNGYGMSQQAVADRTGLDRTTISETTRRLARRRKLIRGPDPDDGRKRLVFAAPETAAAAAKATKAARAAEEQALSGLTIQEDRERLVALLAKAL